MTQFFRGMVSSVKKFIEEDMEHAKKLEEAKKTKAL